MKGVFVELALAVVCAAALGRVAGILLLKLRQARYAKQALAVPRGWRDLCTVPEPYLLGVTTIVLWVTRRVPAEPSAAQLLQAGTGLAIAGLAVAAGFGSAIALLLRLVYVIPGYWIYLRSEEAMLIEHLGEAYGRYREQVGALLPRRRRGRPGRPPAPEERDRSARRGGPRGGDRR